ncbi:hypothetical protein CY34DRAFT_814535 [Suillus luteus UH-Slu-Lm8-n1]|uniref:Uncharacterized protein n=1 Tax=Suillus luteus UH-Slu-Lm8-n1 TaxID=930992 RepID=A0A0C9ZQX8_9AGAM|nr:hypothetical protein CY34DRAFT_814535 [Suillus luteus UH-Slu-Lm8-n1]
MLSSSHITLPHLHLQSLFIPTYHAHLNFAPQFTPSRPCITCRGCAFDFIEICGPAFAADDRGMHL